MPAHCRLGLHSVAKRKEKKKKDYTFRRQINESLVVYWTAQVPCCNQHCSFCLSVFTTAVNTDCTTLIPMLNARVAGCQAQSMLA